MWAARPVLSQPKHSNFISAWGIVMTVMLLALVPAARSESTTPDISAHYRLDIAREPLNTALKDFAIQTGLQVARFTDAGANTIIAGPISGQFTFAEGLGRLLADSGLTYRMINPRTIAIVVSAKAAAAPAGCEPDAPGWPAFSPSVPPRV